MFPLGSANWNNGSNAGVFYRNWNNYRSNDNDNYGFRACDYFPRPDIAEGEYWKHRDGGILRSGEICKAWRSSTERGRPPCLNATAIFTSKSVP